MPVNDEIVEIVKSKEIFFIFEDFNLEFGGITNTVLKRANYLANKEYNINLLSVDKIQNFDYICNKFEKEGILSSNVNFINVYDYYSKKNTFSDNSELILDYILNNNKYHVEQVANNDNSITLNYFKDDTSSEIIKTELFIDNILIYRKSSNLQEFFTKDGFNYLTIKDEIFELSNRNSEKIRFKNINDFLYYFMDELCSSTESKPFLVCDSTAHYYNMNGVKTDVYKVGVMHGNPYGFHDKTLDHIDPNINHLQHLDDLEILVLLTEEVKNDLINELKQDKFTVIPNFISDEVLETNIAQKDFNKIGIFSRIGPEKRISDAIKAFKIASEVNDDAVLEIYGRAVLDNEVEEFNKLKGLVKELKMEDKVLFKGYLADVNVKMQESLFTVMTSTHEGLPLALLESMSNATPVICYGFKYGPKDVISNGIDGCVVEKNNIDMLADEMINLLNNPQRAIDMGLKAREKIKSDFSTSSAGYKWEILFKKVFLNSTLNEIDSLRLENNELKRKNNDLKNDYNSIINSRSWKLTKPLRKIMGIFK